MPNRTPTFILMALLILAALTTGPLEAAGEGTGEKPEMGVLSWCVPPPAAANLAAPLLESAAGSPLVTQVGDIAVIEDDGTLIKTYRPFDLDGSAIQFLRRGEEATVIDRGPAFRPAVGEKLDLGDEDSSFIPFPEGFEFPFFDRRWRRMIVNSNGTLTFAAAEERFTLIPDPQTFRQQPRIAPLWTNLDPGAATGEGGVYVKFLPHRVRVTWLKVPGRLHRNENTFQVTLFDDGRIAFSYGVIETSEAIVGITPGFGDPLDLDLNQGEAVAPQAAGIFESFTEPEFIDTAFVRAFFQHFQDEYDHLFFFFDFDLRWFAYSSFYGYSRDQGTGPALNWGPIPGLEELERFKGLTVMRSLDSYPDDPAEPVIGPFSTLAIAAHEFGHRWLSFVRFIDADGELNTELTTSFPVHWNFFFNSGSSVMFGNEYDDNGDGTFTLREHDRVYGSLDQYLMGLRPASSVGDFFYLTDTDRPWRDVATAPDGLVFTGTRVDVSVDQVIAAEGERIPAYGEAQDSFRVAFVLVSRQGEPPSTASVEQLDRLRREFEEYFRTATDGRGEMTTVLLPK